MSNMINEGQPTPDNPFGITKDMITHISRLIHEGRMKRKAEGKRTTEPTEALFKIPPYDWQADPKGYKDGEGHFRERCFHCGSRFVHNKPWDAFCGPCNLAMMMGGEENLLGWQGKKHIARKIRLPDEEKPVHSKELDDGTSIEFKTGSQVK